MASIDKIVDKLKRQPNGIKIEEADKVLTYYGYRLERQKGSHRQYINTDGDVVTIPVRRPTLKPFYVAEILRRIGL